jgi:hypothetical protein
MNNNSPTNSERFFATLKMRDINRMKKTVNTVMMICLIMMFLITVFVILTSFAVSMKPTPVIAFDAEGKRAVFSGEETVQDETSRVRVYRFLTDFINKFEGVSPNIEEDLTAAYNMLTPNFRQILLDKAVHKEKIEQWRNKNFETKFRIMKIRFLSGSLRVGSTLTVEGIGEMSFRSAIDYSNQGVQKTGFVYFTAAMIVTPVSLDISPDGLLIDIHKGVSFEDFRSLRAFLLENKKEYLLEDESGEVFE